MFLPRTVLSRPLLSSPTRHPLRIYRSFLVRSIHMSQPLSEGKGKGDSGSDYDDVLRNIIQQTSLPGGRMASVSPSPSADSHSSSSSSNFVGEEGGEESVEGVDDGEPTNLLITLDALGTLYGIKNENVGKQYGDIAKKCGVKGLLAHDINKSFNAAYKELAASHPNYGYASGMTPKEWWEQLTIKTFTPLIPFPVPFPPTLAEELWNTFATNGPYTIFPGTIPFFWNMKDLKKLATRTRKGQADWKFRTITIGVVSNSDERVIDILSSLDVTAVHRVISRDGELEEIPRKSVKQESRRLTKALREAGAVGRQSSKILRQIAITKDEVIGRDQVVDFVATSCRLGAAKPQKEIFETAREAARRLVEKRFGSREAKRGWEWYHVGDNSKEDVVGAYEAGGVGILFDPKKELGETEKFIEGSKDGVRYKAMLVGDLREVAEFTEGLSFLYQTGGVGL
ncbi:hypothetical protein TWF718_007112 [Orbilia javanica]|uniref:Uncharacterized protein n=1 Tax=Orbilia javanica TaxID=47235 RepID=A0AAN8MY98_9PEZI